MSLDCTIKQIIEILGLIPTTRKKNELRFGSKGSLSVNLNENIWFDHETQESGGMLDFIVYQGKANDRSSAIRWLEENNLKGPIKMTNVRKKVIRHHTYRDENGSPLKQAVKYEDGSWKQFGWKDSDWKPGTKGIRNVPYRLDELHEDASERFLYIFEGEKDVDRARALGLLATCNSGGAKNWSKELNAFVRDREICIVPDNDTAGLSHAQKLYDCLKLDDIAATIVTSHLEQLNDKEDFSDWMDKNNNDVDAFLELVDADIKNQPTPEQVYLDRFGIKPANALFGMHFDPLNFFYDGLIPSVGLTLIAALPKTGKSWFVLNLAKHMDGNGLPVHYLAAEDNERRLKDRIEKVFRDGVKHLTYHAVMSSETPLPRGVDALFHIEQIVKGTGAKCVIIDTVQSILNPSANNKNYDQTVEEYDALRKLAHKLGIAIIVVHHCKKSSDVATAPLEKVIGSIGITGTAETILVMEQQTGTKDCKLYVTGKDVEQCEKYLTWNGHGFNIDDDVRLAQLGPFQQLVLMLIKETPRCMQKSIVDRTGKDQSQVSKAIDKLVEVGLVAKKEGRLIAQ
ncbi:AAA family ATPase [Amylibacter sp.]|nr:AAA family ATPase [Amylibacter sp.]